MYGSSPCNETIRHQPVLVRPETRPDIGPMMAACHAVGCSFRVVARLTCRATGRCAGPAGSLVNSNRTTTKVAQNMRAEWSDGGCYRERDGATDTISG